MILSFIGGTGPEGLGLATRFAHVGETVVIGSRSPERCAEAAEKIRAKAPQCDAQGMVNVEAVAASEIVFITLPYSGQRATLESLREAIGDKIVVCTVVPMAFEKGRPRAILVEAGSAAEEARDLLPDARVVSAFQNVSAERLLELDHDMGGVDVLVCGDDRESKEVVYDLVNEIPGLRAINAGALNNSRYVEDITVLLARINQLYKTHSGIRIVGIPEEGEA